MRDSLIAVMFIAGIVGSYAYMKRAGVYEDHFKLHPAKRSSKRSTQPFGSAKQGVKQNDEAANRNHVKQNPQYGEAQGSSGDLAEAQGLPSIYEGKGFTESAVESTQQSQLSGKLKKQKDARASRTAIPGVPVHAFVQYRRKALPSGRPVADDGDGIRVYVQCMELKQKGPEYLGERECEKLLGQAEDLRVHRAY